jgi:hypothetical protein
MNAVCLVKTSLCLGALTLLCAPLSAVQKAPAVSA